MASYSAGDKVGSYEILAPLGAGGMGEVYRARDTKLKRDVALKVLPEAFARDPDRMARFQREAEVLASLNHPNIAQIYGVEDRALVMELVEGETLKTPVPLETALHHARQIADALEAAHEKGIVHRDLKPANIMITPGELVKVLDFGLAAVAQPASNDTANSPTLTMRATEAGIIMGTAGYMSPEQASGKPADKRADIWSFGVVLWEMLAGKRLFEGETLSHTLADVLRAPIDLASLPRETPANVRELLRRCLDRDVRNRLRDVGEARVALNSPAPAPEHHREQAAPRTTPWILAAALGVVLVVVSALYWRTIQPVEQPLKRLDVDLGANVSLAPISGTPESTVVLSPDGTRLVYAASIAGGGQRLFVRRLDQAKATELPGTEDGQGPFFSPDGQWIGFSSRGKLNKISVEGGTVAPLTDITIFGGASWSADGNIVVSEPLTKKGLFVVPAAGGPQSKITDLAPQEIAHAFPQYLPGGQAVLFTAAAASDASRDSIEAVTLADHRRKVLVRGGSYGRYLPSGHLLYLNKGTLFAIPFDGKRLETRGTAIPVIEGVGFHVSTGGAQFDFSTAGHGILIYREGSGGPAGIVTLQWIDAAGRREALRAKPGSYFTPRLSPDGKRIALSLIAGADEDVWVYDIERDTMTRLTFGGGRFSNPVWSPNGRYIVFCAGPRGIGWTRADGAGQPQPLTGGNGIAFPWSFSPDGKRVAYYQITGNPQIWTVPVEDRDGQLHAGQPEQFLKSDFAEGDPAISPDGRWIAYGSTQSGTLQIYVRPFPPPSSGSGGQWQISGNGGSAPLWSPRGHELLYQSGDQIMAVSYTVNGDSFVSDKPRVWADKVGSAPFDLSPDGKRLLVFASQDAKEEPKSDHDVVFLMNFFDELRRRVPVK